MTERDQKICEMYRNGVTLVKIADTAKVSHSTIYSVLRKYEIPLRTEIAQRKQARAIETICWQFDNGFEPETIASKMSTDMRTVISVLKTYREIEFEKFLRKKRLEENRKKQEEMLDKARKRASKEKKFSHLEGLIERKQKEALDWEAEHGKSMYGGIEKIIESARQLTPEEQRNIFIMRDFVSGAPMKEILDKYEMSQWEFFKLFEADTESEPGYFPDRPPLDV